MKPGAIWKDIRPADLATLLNAFMGLLAIRAFLDDDIVIGFVLVFMAIIVDGLDGAVARLGGGGGPLGHIIDTLADVVTFVVAPSVGLIATFSGPPGLVAAAIYVAAGLLRLARFETLPDAEHFWGLSTPGGALVIGTATVVAQPYGAAAAIGGAVLAGSLMLMRLALPKLRGTIGIIGVIIIVATASVVLAVPQWAWWALLGQGAAVLAYLLAGPAYLKAQGRLAGDHGQA